MPGLSRTLPYDTEYVGATRITDANGRVLAARNTAEGPGIVIAGIEIGAHTPAVPLDDTFWIPRLPLAMRAYWHQQHACAKAYYRSTGRAEGLAAASQHTMRDRHD